MMEFLGGLRAHPTELFERQVSEWRLVGGEIVFALRLLLVRMVAVIEDWTCSNLRRMYERSNEPERKRCKQCC